MRPDTVRRQRRAIARAWSFIAARRHDALTLEQIADVAAMSPCHFSRVYEGFVGESVMQSVRRDRFRQAQTALTASDEKIAGIALQAGYSCGQSFARACKRITGDTPSETRAGALDAQRERPLRLSLVEFDERKAFGIPFVGDYSDEIDAFDELTGYAYCDTSIDKISARRQTVFGLTMLHDDWHTTKPSRRAAIILSALPGRYAGHSIPGSAYVAFDHQGGLEATSELVAAAKRLIPHVFQRTVTDGPILREWTVDAQLLPPDRLQMRIYLPVSA